MLGLLASGNPAHDLPGLVWRAQDGIEMGPARPPARDIDTLPEPRKRKTPLRVGGVQVAFMISARGCFGECAYCSIRAFSRDQGLPYLHLRDPAAVAVLHWRVPA